MNFHILTTLILLYLLLRFVWPLPWHWLARLLLGLALAFAAKFHYLSLLLYGSMFAPEWPQILALLLGWGFGFVVLMLVFTLIFDAALLLRSLLQACRLLNPRPAAANNRWRLGLAALAAALATVGLVAAVRVPDVRRIELPIAHLPPAFEGLRLVQLTDLHLSRLLGHNWVQVVVQRTNALQPDVLVLTGDLIDGSTTARQHDIAPLAQLRARLGVYAVAGNHEYYFDYPRWKPVLEQQGLRFLDNQHTLLQQGGASLTLAGITDKAAHARGLPGPDLAQALQGAPVGSPVILLAHRPEEAPTHARAGVAVQLSGHTHGGMAPGLSWLVRRFNNGFDSGLYQLGDMRLYVSNGTGLWMGFPIRLGRPAEITEFTLRRAGIGPLDGKQPEARPVPDEA